MPKGTRKHALSFVGIEFVWQLLERYETEEAFDKAHIQSIGRGGKTKTGIKDAIRKLGLSFGMEFPAGFVKRTK